MKKLLIFIVAYQAEAHIASLLERIPKSVWESEEFITEVLLIDDGSTDKTSEKANGWMLEHGRLVSVLRNPKNQGYGGNQKLGYRYAIDHHFDAVVLLHGDGQYPPEQIEALVTPIFSGDADAVFGSRMMQKKEALAGGMPFYKFLGNIILTKFQNFLLKQHLSEYHSGFRAYSVTALKQLPFECNSQDFAFDCEIIIQLRDTGKRIAEIPIPTRYAGEICRVNGVKYAWQVISNTILSRFQRISCYYAPKFDYAGDSSPYEDKTGFYSSHSFAVENVTAGSHVLDIGCAEGFVARELRQKGCIVTETTTDDFSQATQDYDYILLLDVLDNLTAPEDILRQIRHHHGKNTKVIIVVGNIAFFVMRLSLFVGQFNYGKRGILDFSNLRLFTLKSLRRTLEDAGFSIISQTGIPVPWPFVFKNKFLARMGTVVNRFLIKISKGLFAYQIAVIAEPIPPLKDLLKEAEKEGRHILAETLRHHSR